MVRVSTVFALMCLLSLTGATRGDGHGADVKVVVMEGHDAILPCSPSTKTNMESKLFDWKKDGHMEVFMYDAGDYYSDDFSGQDEQFKGRVSHFPDELKFGNASIMINNTKMADSGNYTCAFPRLQPAGQIYNIELVVEPTFKDRAGEISGASPKPYVSICKVTDVGVKLRCEVQEAFPRPKLQWQDSDGNDLRAEETQVSERDGRYSVILQTTVTPTSTNCFHCVAKQEKINHVVTAEITVPEKLFEDKTTWFLFGWLSGVLTVAPLTAFLAMKYFQNRRKKGPDEEKKSLPNGVSQERAPLNEVNV